MKKRLLTTLISAAILCLPVAANAGPFEGPHGKHHGPMMMLRSLDLTAAQRQDIRQLTKEFRADAESQNSEETLRADVRALLESGNADEASLTTLFTSHWEATQSQRYAAAVLRHRIYHVLTSEQQAELDEKMAKRAAISSHRKGGKMREDRSPFAMLDLTDEQQASLEAIKAAMATQRESKMEAMKTQRAAEQALIKQAEFDDDAWYALDGEFKFTAITQQVAHTLMRQDMLAVLTTEQREQLEQWRESHPRKHGRKDA